jgi:hypothetical protein
MDPMTLGAAVVAALTPYLVKTGEAVATEVGKRAFSVGESLLKALWSRWKDKPEFGARLHAFVENQTAGREGLSLAVVADAASDRTFAEALEQLLEGGPPEVFVHQIVKEAGEVSAGEILEMIRGRYRIVQDVEKAEKVVGPKFGKIG